MVISIFKTIINIIKGWYFKLFGKKQDLASERLTICNDCKHRIETSLGYACEQCGCILDAKTRVDDEHCDLDRW